jgi:hypothetical protein
LSGQRNAKADPRNHEPVELDNKARFFLTIC